jgi:hypothetical protein
MLCECRRFSFGRVPTVRQDRRAETRITIGLAQDDDEGKFGVRYADSQGREDTTRGRSRANRPSWKLLWAAVP